MYGTVLGALLMALGFIVLWGWTTGDMLMTAWHVGFRPRSADHGLGLLCLGLVLVLLAGRSRRLALLPAGILAGSALAWLLGATLPVRDTLSFIGDLMSLRIYPLPDSGPVGREQAVVFLLAATCAACAVFAAEARAYRAWRVLFVLMGIGVAGILAAAMMRSGAERVTGISAGVLLLLAWAALVPRAGYGDDPVQAGSGENLPGFSDALTVVAFLTLCLLLVTRTAYQEERFRFQELVASDVDSLATRLNAAMEAREHTVDRLVRMVRFGLDNRDSTWMTEGDQLFLQDPAYRNVYLLAVDGRLLWRSDFSESEFPRGQAPEIEPLLREIISGIGSGRTVQWRHHVPPGWQGSGPPPEARLTVYQGVEIEQDQKRMLMALVCADVYPEVIFGAAIGGQLGDRYRLRILDAAGSVVWQAQSAKTGSAREKVGWMDEYARTVPMTGARGALRIQVTPRASMAAAHVRISAVLLLAGLVVIFALGLFVYLFQLTLFNRRRLEDEVARRKAIEAELREARDRAEHLAAAKAEFLAVMSHEIRTPLNGVLGMAELLAEMGLSERQLEKLEVIRGCGDSLLTILNDILDFSKIEAGRLEVEERVFCLADCLREVTELFSPQAQQRGLNLRVELDPGLPRHVIGDSTRLRQVLSNLLGNAMKFTSRGEVVVAGRCVTRAEDFECLEFSVRDSGIGIPADKIDRLFDAFTQADASTTRQYGGTGLGLAICKRLVEAMGGDIVAESEPGRGSIFRFTLKVPAVRDYVSAAARAESTLAGCGFLVCEDDAARQRRLCALRESWDAQPVPVRSLAEDHKLTGSLPRLCGLVVGDVEDDDALGAVAARAREARGPGFGVIRIAGDVKPGVAQDTEAVDEYLPRPLETAALLAALMRVVSSSAGTAPGAAEPQAESAEPAGDLRILVAEDNRVNQAVAMQMLRKLGHPADLAADGREAVDACIDGNYDLVFMDVQMPRMDGVEATREIMARIPEPERPTIVALTANVMEEDRQRYLEVGMMDVLGKPVSMKGFREAILRWGDRRRRIGGEADEPDREQA